MLINDSKVLHALNKLNIRNINLFPFSDMITPTVLIERGAKNSEVIDCGKGKDLKSAFLSALFESFERYSAEIYEEYILFGNSNDLSKSYNLCTPSSLYPNNPMSEEADTISLKWSEGYDLLNKKLCYIPLECISFPSKSTFSFVSTIGLASGQCKTDAIVHAIYEAIEHDTLTTHLLMKKLGQRLETNNSEASIILKDLKKRKIEIDIRFLENIYEVPCVIALMKNAPNFEVYNIAGMGANLDIEIAIMRAITECQQSYDFWYRKNTLGSLEEKEIIHPPLELDENFYLNNNTMKYKSDKVEFDTITEELNSLISKLGEYVSEILCIDITNKNLEIPCVRVIIPDFLETDKSIFLRRKGVLLKEELIKQGKE